MAQNISFEFLFLFQVIRLVSFWVKPPLLTLPIPEPLFPMLTKRHVYMVHLGRI